MRRIRIFDESFRLENTTHTLNEKAHHHIARVLRLSAGDTVFIFNGRGDEAEAQISEASKKSTTINILHAINENRESPLKIHLFQALLRNEKMDWVMQKAVELGVNEITPIITTYGQIKLSDERKEKRIMHWEEVIKSAAEQCWRNQLPALNPIINFNNVIPSLNSPSFILHPHAESNTIDLNNRTSINLFIGPEGGFSEEEVAFAKQHGVKALQLGPRILRTETAALTALSIFQAQFGDLL